MKVACIGSRCRDVTRDEKVKPGPAVGVDFACDAGMMEADLSAAVNPLALAANSVEAAAVGGGYFQKSCNIFTKRFLKGVVSDALKLVV